MKNVIIISEALLAITAVILFAVIKTYIKKHENEDMAKHRNFIRKISLALILVGAMILSLGAIYLVIK